jgi:hypothetical protein
VSQRFMYIVLEMYNANDDENNTIRFSMTYLDSKISCTVESGVKHHNSKPLIKQHTLSWKCLRIPKIS